MVHNSLGFHKFFSADWWKTELIINFSGYFEIPLAVNTPDIESLKNQKCLILFSLLIIAPNLIYEIKTAHLSPGFILLVEIIETIVVMKK